MEVICFRCGEHIELSEDAKRCKCGDVTVYKTPDGIQVGHRKGAEYGVKRKSA